MKRLNHSPNNDPQDRLPDSPEPPPYDNTLDEILEPGSPEQVEESEEPIQEPPKKSRFGTKTSTEVKAFVTDGKPQNTKKSQGLYIRLQKSLEFYAYVFKSVFFLETIF